MKQKKYYLVLDQGTTSTRAVLFDEDFAVCGLSRKEIEQQYRKPGWVEQDANEIWFSVLTTVSDVMETTDTDWDRIISIGITNQRETAVLWDRTTGLPRGRAIVWQSRQTNAMCDRLRSAGKEALIHEKTGLFIDPYFSATKFSWLLDQAKPGRERAGTGDLLCGTIDSWLIWKLTGGAVHATDSTNAARTQLFDIVRRCWDSELCDIFGVPEQLLPEVRPAAGFFGHTDPDAFFGESLPITGVAGDQQAALFGQQCTRPGEVKNTYGTGCFLLMHTGETPVFSENGLLTTIAWEAEGTTVYALEGSVFVAGSAVQWLRDSMGLIVKAEDVETMARQVDSTDGVVFVPAFVGLGAPYWDDRVRGAVFGMTRGTTSSHLARAVLSSIALQSADVLFCMAEESGIPVRRLLADGGASENDLLMQMQADYTDVTVVRGETEATAKGAALFAAIGAGRLSMEEAAAYSSRKEIFRPKIDASLRNTRIKDWQRAVAAARVFSDSQDANGE